MKILRHVDFFFLLMLALLFSACECETQVMDYQPDGGLSGAYCAQECEASLDCPPGMHCSWHPRDPKGVCFKNR